MKMGGEGVKMGGWRRKMGGWRRKMGGWREGRWEGGGREDGRVEGVKAGEVEE